MPTDLTRRSFLAASGAAAGSLAFGVPAVNALGANERMSVGLIGCGNRGRTILREVLKNKHNVVALADIAQFRMDNVSKEVVQAGQEKPDEYKEFQGLLNHPGLDAVIIATPDHHHKEMLLAACEAKKHAYVEKPLSRTIEEGKQMVDAVRRAGVVVQVGNQRHSGDHWKRCRDVVQGGDFGDLVWVKVWDCRNWLKKDPFAVPDTFTEEQQKQVNWQAFLGKAPTRPFDAVRYWSWRWFWDYAGGLMTDIGAHQLDIVQWLGGVDAPKSVVANGGVYHFKHWETPDVLHGVWDYGKFAATFAVEFVNGHDGVGAAFYGTKQTLVADASGTGEVRLYDGVDPPKPGQEPKDRWKVENETAAHVKNWLDSCVRGRDPNSTIELGHKVITAAHLANLSFRTGRKVYWDAEREAVVGG